MRSQAPASAPPVLASAPSGAAGAPTQTQQAKAWKAAQDFEAVAIDQFLQPMFATVDLSATPLGGGEAEKTWQSMMITEMGKQMERGGGLGIAQSVYAEILRMQEQGGRPPGLPSGPASSPATAALAKETMP